MSNALDDKLNALPKARRARILVEADRLCAEHPGNDKQAGMIKSGKEQRERQCIKKPVFRPDCLRQVGTTPCTTFYRVAGRRGKNEQLCSHGNGFIRRA